MKLEYQNDFRVFFNRHYANIYRNFLVRTGNPFEAEDLTQDTFLRAAKGFENESLKPTLAWLATIAGNVFKNWYRYHQASKRDGIENSIEEIKPCTDDQSQEQHLIVKQQITALNEAIQSLPKQMRHCFTLFYLQEYKYQEISALMGINIQTVKSQISRGRKKVTESLGKEPDWGKDHECRS